MLPSSEYADSWGLLNLTLNTMNISTVKVNLSHKGLAQKILFAFLVLQTQMVFAALAVGDRLSPMEFHDQHERLHTTDK